MFRQPQLKVYIDGYRRKGGSQPPEVELSPRSFLQQVNPDSYSADRQAFWYLKLAGTCYLQGSTISVTAPHVSHGRLLGQQAAADAKPISEAVYQKLSPEEQNLYTRGLLRVLGIDRRASDIPITKKHEIFIPYPPEMETAPTFEVEDAIKIFQDLAAERTVVDPTLPFHLQGSRHNASSDPENQYIKLRPGDLVFFKPAGNKVGEVAISSIWRRRAGGSSHDYFRKLTPEILPFHKDRQQLTIAEQLFGFVEQRARGQMNMARTRALASRLRFSFGLVHSDQNDLYEGEILLKVLDSPKPPSPALYFKRRDGRDDYIAKNALNPAHHVPQGRKFYLHRLGNTGTPWQTLAPTENLKQKSYVQPLKAGLVFYFHVDFENLSRRELALLCYALRPMEQFRHKVGMGKPLGLGKVRIDPVGIFYVDRQARYQETSLFEAPRYHGTWLLMKEPPKAWPERYTLERAAAAQELGQFPSFDTLRQSFRETMDPDIRTALELLGNPSKVRRAAHTPQIADTSDQEMEKETYRWFVANDLGSGAGDKQEILKPLSDSSTSLPTLPEHPRSG
jgi:CRISPR-associated protein (TIGR03986 family)